MTEKRDEPNEKRTSRAVFPSALVFGGALLSSLFLHFNMYKGLGALEGLFPPRALPPSEVSFVVLDSSEPQPPEPQVAPTETETTQEPAPEEAPPERDRRAPRPRRVATPPVAAPPPPEPPPEPEPVLPTPTPAVPTPPAPPPPPQDERRSIVQHSDDPNVEPPPEARFLADESRQVEEETMAAMRNTLRDDAEQSAAQEEPSEADNEGNAPDELSADTRDVEGDDSRRVTQHEAEEAPARESEPPSTSRHASDQGSATSSSGGSQSAQGNPTLGREGGAAARGGGQPPGQDVIVTDQFGTFVVRAPLPSAVGSGPGAGGGAHIAGSGRGTAGEGRMAGRAGELGGGREALRGTQGGEQLGLSYSDFESVYGEEELRQAREARLEERRSRARGRSREREWAAFRSAIENYTPEVRIGNQTALNAAASPFASFLSDMHRRIHREFADRYIAGLGMSATEGLNDESLRTTLEISVNRDGSIHRVGIVRTSGNTLFDFGAFSSVWRAQPFPTPPDVILSGDGRAWLRWHFDRGPRHCGTWNAEPYMLRNTPDPVDDGEPSAPPPVPAPRSPAIAPTREEGIPG